jgi:hypothetical protein
MTAAMPGAAPGAPVRVTLVSRVDCHLCDQARVVVARVCADLGVGWEELDVDADPDLLARYHEEVPVTLVDGRQHDFWRVDEQRLRTALTTPA